VKPLEGITVLDLSRVLAVPFCTQVLSDLGATVWKVEPPWGDDTRRWGPPFVQEESSYYLSVNRGKKSVAIDLKDPRGAELVKRLAARADVLVENFKVGDLARYGLDYSSLSVLNPQLVYASITGFGQTGPRADALGYDTVLQGMTGIMSLTGEPEGPPMKVGVAWIDILTGLTTAVGIFAALRERELSERGQYLDLALFDVGLMAMVNQIQSYLVTEVSPTRLGNVHPTVAPAQSFEASDGWFVLTAGNDEQYRRMCETIGRLDLWEDPRFKTNSGRLAHLEELAPELAEVFCTRTRSEWLERLKVAGVPATPIYDLGEALGDAQAEARGLVWKVPHPKLGEVPLMANALQHMSRTPASPASHPPLLGEHTREVLEEVLGLDASEIEALERDHSIATVEHQ
jgi:crotonobetainyl-CoA:carnitine CoA-transferase CaiB-like acyl-CoA transferase